MSVSGSKQGYTQGYPQRYSQQIMWPFKKTTVATPEILQRLIQLEVELTELQAKHLSLRGKVYAAGIHKHPLRDSEEARSETIPRSKDELRKMAGIRAGKPYTHKDETN